MATATLEAVPTLEKLPATLPRAGAIDEWVSRIEPRIPQVVAEQHARLATRLREALAREWGLEGIYEYLETKAIAVGI